MQNSFEIPVLEDIVLEIDGQPLGSTVSAVNLPNFDNRFSLIEDELSITLQEEEGMELTMEGAEGVYHALSIPFEPATELVGSRPKNRRPYGI